MSTDSAPFAARVNKELGGLGCGEGTNEPRWFPGLQLHPRAPRAGGILPYLDPGEPPLQGAQELQQKMPWLSPPELVVRVWQQQRHWGECGHSSPRHTSTQAGQASGQTQLKSFANLFLNNQEFCRGQILPFLGSLFLPGSHPPGSFKNCFQFLEE